MWTGDLAPDNANLGSTDLLASAIDESDLLSEVEVGALSVLDTLNLDERGTWGAGVLATLVAQVATPEGMLSVFVLVLSYIFSAYRFSLHHLVVAHLAVFALLELFLGIGVYSLDIEA